MSELGARIAASALFSVRRSRYQAIVQTIEEDIAAARFKPGDRLPTQRELAAELKLAMGTVTRAYSEAQRRGLIEGEVGRGTFIAAPRIQSLDVVSRNDPIDLSVNRMVPEPALTGLASSLRALSAQSNLTELLSYQEPAGKVHHRAAGATWIARAGLKVGIEEILVCNGAQHAICVALGTLTAPGDVVLTEELNYPGIRLLEQLYHLRLQGVPLDHEGLDPRELERLCELTGARVLLCTPTLHNPTSAVMSLERRRRVAEIAVRRQLTVIENDPFAGLESQRILPITALIPDRSYYATSASKIIGAGFRIGFLVPPHGMVERAIPILQATVWMSPPIMGEMFSGWLADGTVDRILEWHQEEAQKRQDIARTLLKGLDYRAHPNGYHIWMHLPKPWRGAQFTSQLARRGVVVSPAETFAVGRDTTPHAVRVCLGGVQDPKQLQRGLEILLDELVSGPYAQSVVA